MIKFFRNAFRGLFSFCVILGIIGLFIGVISAFGVDPRLGILAIAISFVALILSAGLTSTILYMDERLETIEKNISRIGNNSQFISRNYFQFWE